MLRNLAYAARIGALATHPLGQKLGDDVKPLNRREVIALDHLVEVDRHAYVHVGYPDPARCRDASVLGDATRRAGRPHHLRKRFRSWRTPDRNPASNRRGR